MHRKAFRKHAVAQVGRGGLCCGEQLVDAAILGIVHPWTTGQFTIVQPEPAPVRSRFDELLPILRTVFHGAFDHDVDVRLEQRKIRVGPGRGTREVVG